MQWLAVSLFRGRRTILLQVALSPSVRVIRPALVNRAVVLPSMHIPT